MTLARSLAPWLLVVVAVGLCPPVDEAAAQKRGGTLVMLVRPEPPTLAAYISTAGPIGQVTSKIFEGLLEYDFNLRPTWPPMPPTLVAPRAKPGRSSKYPADLSD